MCFRSSARLATHVLQSSSKCKQVSGAIIALPLVVLDLQYYREHWDVGASSRSCSSWLCSVLLCWMQLTALGLKRLQSPPFDLYATIKQYLSSPSSWWLYWDIFLVTVEDRRPLGGSNMCFRSSAQGSQRTCCKQVQCVNQLVEL